MAHVIFITGILSWSKFEAIKPTGCPWNTIRLPLGVDFGLFSKRRFGWFQGGYLKKGHQQTKMQSDSMKHQVNNGKNLVV